MPRAAATTTRRTKSPRGSLAASLDHGRGGLFCYPRASSLHCDSLLPPKFLSTSSLFTEQSSQCYVHPIHNPLSTNRAAKAPSVPPAAAAKRAVPPVVVKKASPLPPTPAKKPLLPREDEEDEVPKGGFFGFFGTK